MRNDNNNIDKVIIIEDINDVKTTENTKLI